MSLLLPSLLLELLGPFSFFQRLLDVSRELIIVTESGCDVRISLKHLQTLPHRLNGGLESLSLGSDLGRLSHRRSHALVLVHSFIEIIVELLLDALD